jgi:predicted MFS family arabinose efflux permease
VTSSNSVIQPHHPAMKSAWYSSTSCPACLLGVLLLINIFNYMDRSLIGTLADPISRELRISDTELGIIGGLAFMLVYTVAALVMARWADRGHAKTVILLSIAVWSLMTSLCAFASGFLWLLAARIGMAIGEAGLVPAAQTLLARRFSAAKFGAVIATFWAGTSLGDALAPVAGGLLNDAIGWRTTFLILGPLALSAIPLAALVIPGNAGSHERRSSPEEVRPVASAIRLLWSIRAYRLIWLGAALALAAPSAYGFYIVPFLMRAHQVSSGAAGAWLGPALAVAGVVGTLIGGTLFDRLTLLSMRAGLLVPAVMPVFSAMFAVLAWHASSWHATVVLYSLAAFSHMLIVGPMYAVIQLISPSNMRAMSVAFFNMGMTLMGGIVGPLLVGLLSDVASAQWGEHSLTPALSFMALFQVGAGVTFARAAWILGRGRLEIA